VLIVNFNVHEAREFIHDNFTNDSGEKVLLFGFVPVLSGRFTDFTAGWYSNVGSILCMTMMINILSPHGSLLFDPFVECMRRCWDRSCKCKIKKKKDKGNDEVNTKQELQSELENLYTGTQIRVHFVYAQIYTTVWASLMYSSGIPALYPIGFLFFAVLYWVCKVLLLKFFQRTTKFNENLQLVSLSYMKYGLLIHMIIGGIMYTNSRIFSQQNQEKISAEVQYILKKLPQVDFMEGRFESTHARIYLAIFLALVFLYIIKQCVLRKVSVVLAKVLLCRSCRKKENERSSKEEAKAHRSMCDNIFNEFDIAQLTELYKRCTRELNDYKDLINTQNLEKSKFSRNLAEAHKAKLVWRIRSIEAVIDNHLKLLLHRANKSDQAYQKYIKFTYFQKLVLLMVNEKKLQEKSLVYKVLRMKSLTQSYYINDSQQYHVAKRMIKIIDQEDFHEVMDESRNMGKN